MADTSIDQSKLPRVKEVCRDFAVLEDHTLAYNLQEQEIENHLASNIQRTRLVQHDLLVAKKLQEEEDLKAQARIQKRHKDLEHQDSEIAQEIQEKLVIEAEERLRQEEKDEDIARKLQERERKRQPKQASERQGHELLEDGYYQETRGTGSKEIRDTAYGKMRAGVKQLELQDAEIARQLQEEELRVKMTIKATRSDRQAAQVAQDEEIARLLMAEEKKAYKRGKMLDKVPSDKRRQEPEWQPHAVEHAHPRSRDGYEAHRSKNDKPARPPPPPTLTDYAELKGPQHGSTRPANRSESAYKGSSHC